MSFQAFIYLKLWKKCTQQFSLQCWGWNSGSHRLCQSSATQLHLQSSQQYIFRTVLGHSKMKHKVKLTLPAYFQFFPHSHYSPSIRAVHLGQLMSPHSYHPKPIVHIWIYSVWQMYNDYMSIITMAFTIVSQFSKSSIFYGSFILFFLTNLVATDIFIVSFLQCYIIRTIQYVTIPYCPKDIYLLVQHFYNPQS